jgi:hypothetical protein
MIYFYLFLVITFITKIDKIFIVKVVLPEGRGSVPERGSIPSPSSAIVSALLV